MLLLMSSSHHQADRAEQVRRQKELLMKKMEEIQRKVVLSEKLQVQVARCYFNQQHNQTRYVAYVEPCRTRESQTIKTSVPSLLSLLCVSRRPCPPMNINARQKLASLVFVFTDLQTAQKAAEIRAQQLEEVKAREQEVTKARQLAEQEEKMSHLATKFSSLDEEVQKKTEKLHKLIKKYQGVKAEIVEMKEDHLRDKARLMNIRHDLDAQLKLKSLIIEYFLPPGLKT